MQELNKLMNISLSSLCVQYYAKEGIKYKP